MSLQFSDGIRIEIAGQLFYHLIDESFIAVYTGPVPASLFDAPKGTKLLTLPFDLDKLSAGDDLSSYITEAIDGIAEASGTAAYFRVWYAEGGYCLAQGNVSATGDGGDLELSRIEMSEGDSVALETFRITAGNEPPPPDVH